MNYRRNDRFSKTMWVCSVVFSAAAAHPAMGDILGVAGPNSSANQPPMIVQPPTDLTDQCVTNQSMQAFNEKQQVTTSATWSTDGGSIPQGTTFVNSHMIFLNQPDTSTGSLSHKNVVWRFDFPIIGTMSDMPGNFEAASDRDFASPFTNYSSFPTKSCGTSPSTGDRVAPYPDRGIEPATGDQIGVSGNTLTISLNVTQPGDWVRVLTRGQNVGIDIKPGSYPNCFNINGDGVVPVAILGSASLNVSNINTSSLSLNGLAVRVKPNNQNQCSVQNVNGDSYPDLVCQFQDNTANWIQGSSVGVVTGLLNDGTPLRGTDSICIQP